MRLSLRKGVLLRKDFRMRASSFKHLYKALYKVRKQRLESPFPKMASPVIHGHTASQSVTMGHRPNDHRFSWMAGF